MKLTHQLAFLGLMISFGLEMSAQTYIPGHTEIQLNTTKSGLSIQNLQSSSTSALDVYSDNNRNFQLGIGNSNNTNVGPDVAYLFTPAGVPIEFYAGGLFRRMHLTADGKFGINAPTNFVEFLYVGRNTKIEQGNLFVNQGISTFINNQNKAIVRLSTDSTAIKGSSTNQHGITGVASTIDKAGVYGRNDILSGKGVFGESTNGNGVLGISVNDNGIIGSSTHESGIYGNSTNWFGVEGESDNSYGVYGKSNNITAAGVYGESTNFGVIGHGIGIGDGLLGSSLGGHGVVGRSTDNGNTQFDFYADGSSMDWGSSSSKRWKKNIISIDHPLEKLSQIKGVYYDWDEEHGGQHDIGFIAEEVGAVLPEIVSYEENGVDAIAMDYSKMTALLAEAIKELQQVYDKKLVMQEEQIAYLNAEIATLKSRLEGE